MANRYWVGGTGTWNTTSTTNWSASSGGASGASVPTTADSVFFDQAATYTVTMTGALNCLDITVSAGTVQFATGTTPTLTVAGNVAITAGTTTWNSTGTVTLSATTSKTITSGGTTFDCDIQISGAGGTKTLQDDLTLGSTRSIILTSGTLALNNRTLTTALFSSNNSNTRVLSFGTTGQLTLTGNNSTIINMPTMTGFTYTGTPRIFSSYNGSVGTRTFNLGATAGVSPSNTFNLSFNTSAGTGLVINPSTDILSLQGTYFNGDFTNISGTINNDVRSFYGNLTIPASGGTFTAGTNVTNIVAGISVNIDVQRTLDFPFLVNSVGGTLNFLSNFTLGSTRTFTLTAGTLALGANTLTTGLFSSSNSNARTINFGTGKIVLTSATTSTIWTTSTVTNLTISGTPLVECQGGGTGVTKSINTGALSEANSISFSFLETTGTATYSILGNFRNIIVNGSQTVANTSFWIYGDFTHSTSNGTTTFTAGTNAWIFTATSGAKSINNIAGFTYDFPWTFGSASSTATWTLQANLTLGATRQLTLTNGTLDINSKTISAAGITITTGTPSLANTGTGSFTTILPFTHTSGSFTLPFDITTSSATGYTFSAGTLALGSNTLTTRTFVSNTSTARTLNFGTGKILLNANTTSTIWNQSTITNFAVAGTPLVECIGGGTSVTKSITVSSSASASQIVNFSLLETTGTVTYSFGTVTSIKNLTCNGSQTVTWNTALFLTSFTHLTTNGTTTFTAGSQTFSFTATSGSETINNIAGFTYDFPWDIGRNASTATYTLANDLTLGATRQLTWVTGTFDVNSKTISAAGITINNTAGTFTLANTGTGSFTTTLPFTHTSGTFTLPFAVTTSAATGYTLNGGTLSLGTNTLSTPVFVSTGSTARTLNYGTGQLALTGNNATIFNTTTTNFTTSGTVYINCTYTGSTGTRTIVTTFTEAQSASYNVATTGTTGIVLSPSATDTIALTGSFNNIDFTGFTGTLSNTARTIYGNLVIPSSGGTYTAGTLATTFGGTSGTDTITTNGRTLDFPITFNGVGGTFQLADNLTIGSTRTTTLTAGTVDINNLILSTGFFGTSGSSAKTLAFGSTGDLELTGFGGFIFDYDSATTNLTITGTLYINCTYTGSSGTRTIDLTGVTTEAQALTFNVATTGTTGIVLSPTATDTVELTGGFGTINLTGFTGTFGNIVRTIYGSLTLPVGGTISSGSAITTFAATTSQTITSNGRTLNFRIRFDGVGGTWTLQDALNVGSQPTDLYGGSLVLNNFTLTTTILNIDDTVIRNINFGSSGGITITSTGTTVLNGINLTNFTYTGTPYFNCTGSTAGQTRTFTLGPTGAFPDNTFDVKVTGSNGIVLGTGSGGSVALTGDFRDINLTGFTETLTNTARTIYGNLTVPSAGGTLTAGASSTTIAAPATVGANEYSVYFDGTNSLSLPAGSQWAFGTGDFTIEAYVYLRTSTSSRLLTNRNPGTTGAGTWSITLTPTFVNFTEVIAGEPGPSATISSILNQWTHVAVCRSSGVTKIFIDGNQVVSAAQTTNFNNVSYLLYIATSPGETFLTTNISNIRIIKGTALYTANFTPSTSPLTAIAGTSLLTCQGQAFVDNSGNNYPITLNSSPNISTISPFAVTATTKTITTNGRTLDFPLIIGDIITGSNTGNVQLSDALTLGSTRGITLSYDTLNLNNLTLSANSFTSNISAIRTLAFGSTGQLTLVGSNTTIVNMAIANNFTYSGTPVVYSSYNGATGTRTFNIGSTSGATANNVFDLNITSGNGLRIQAATDSLSLNGYYGNANFTNLTQTVTNTTRSVYGNLTIPTAGGTFTAGANATTGLATTSVTYDITRTIDFPLTLDGVGGNVTLANNLTLGSTRALTVTSGNLNFPNLTINTGTFVSTGSNVRNINFGSTGNLTLAGSNTTLLNITNATDFTYSGTPYIYSSYTGSSGTRTFVVGSQGVDIANNIFSVQRTGTTDIVLGTATDSIALTGSYKDVDLTGHTNTLTNTERQVYGNLTIPATMTLTAGTANTTIAVLQSNTTKTITTNGKTLDFPIIIGSNIGGTGGTISLNDSLTIGSTRLTTLTETTFNLNGFTCSTGTFSSTLGNTNITFNGGTLTVTGASFTINNPESFTTTKGTGNGIISMTSASAKTFTGNSVTYNCSLNQGGAGNLTITGNNSFEMLKFSYGATGNANILIPKNGNTTITSGIESGVSNTKYFGIIGTGSGTRANLLYAGSGNIVADYLRTSNVSFMGNSWAEQSNGYAPLRWYLGTNSLDVDDNLGAIYQPNDGSTAPIVYYIISGNSWTVPSNWDSANNTIHIYGAGGGSSGSRTPAGGSGNIIGSGGGGGGGYTQVINFVANINSTVAYSIGEGGAAGVANVVGQAGNGGPTTFSTYTANGGKGSTISNTAAGVGGAGGIGGTFNGGNGGNGAFTTNSANNSSGGGGGGSGGPLGKGGNGGLGNQHGTFSSTAGGGGGGAGGGGNGGNSTTSTGGAAGASPYGASNPYGKGGVGVASSGGSGLGAFGRDVLNSIGGGGGAGGGYTVGISPGGNTIGAGAGGASASDGGTTFNGETGGTGAIIIAYYACLSPVFSSTSSMFLVF